MHCKNCGFNVDSKWKFCPKCGANLRNNLFERIFDRFHREMQEFDKMFERQFEVFDLSPFFQKPIRGKGFTIKITGGTGQKPKVIVQTFGDVDKNSVAKELSKLGVKNSEMPSEIRQKKEPIHSDLTEKKSLPKIMEEPKTDVKRIGQTVVVNMHLPDVKEEHDIEIKDLEESVEVKAIAGDKAYFKILTKPSDTKVVNKKFKDGNLRLEFA